MKAVPMDAPTFASKALRYFQLRQLWIGAGRGTSDELNEMRKLDAELMKATGGLLAAQDPAQKG